METKNFPNVCTQDQLGFANLPNQVHRKFVKKGFEFTLLVVGESGLGKSTLINSLFMTEINPGRTVPTASECASRTLKIQPHCVEIEERGVRLRLTVVDTPGFADAMNNHDSFDSIVHYIDSQFEKYLADESGLNRRNITDSRVHCCFYFINPSNHGLKPLDIEFMLSVHHRVNIVPVIAKADTLTQQELARLKQKILQEIGAHEINIYKLPEVDEDEDADYKQQVEQLKEAVPFAVVGSNCVIDVRGRKMRGRVYPWGVVEVENPDHCDFVKLRTMLITHMQDLQEVTHEVHYENFRSHKLARGKRTNENTDSVDSQLSAKERELADTEAELDRMRRMVAQMEARMSGSAIS